MEEIDKRSDEANKIGFFGCLSYILGNCIGVGIFIAPSAVTASVGSVGLSLIMWIVYGLISLLGSIVYIELGTAVLEPGCDYAYTLHVGWNSIAFGFMWVGVILSYPASAAILILTFGHYVIDGISPIVKFDPSVAGILEWSLGIMLLVPIIWINFHSLGKGVAVFQILATSAKLIAMALIIVGAAYCFIFKEQNDNYLQPWKHSRFSIHDYIVGFNAGFYTYCGWDILNYNVNEIRNPRRNLPLSLLIGIPIVILSFTSVIGAYFVVLSPEEVIHADAIATLFSQKVFGSFSYTVPFMIAILICGSLNSTIFCSSRYVFAAARERQLPKFLSCINEESGSPRASLVAQGLAIAMLSFFDVHRLIDYVGFVIILQKVVGITALLWIRYKKIPVDKNVVRVPLILSVICFLIFAALAVIPIIYNFVTSLSSISITGSGILLYHLLIKKRRNFRALQHLDETLTSLSMKLLDCKTDLKVTQEEVNIKIDSESG